MSPAGGDRFRAALDWPWITAQFRLHYAIGPAELSAMSVRRLAVLLAALPT